MQAEDSYEPVIGLEVHCQLQTASKAFSSDSARFGAQPNTHVDERGLIPVKRSIRHRVPYDTRLAAFGQTA